MGRFSIAAIILTLVGVIAAAQRVDIQFDGRIFNVHARQGTLVVYAGAGDVPPLAGATAVENGWLTFRPKFPIAPRVTYRVVYTPPGGAPIEKTFNTAANNATPTARVDRIYPTAHVLPSNQLRLYIYFISPMSRGDAAQHIHVLDAAGKPIRDVFLPGQELWDPQNTRLTMTFDPGRIKRDLTSNRKMGPPIAEGKRYTILIDREWRDANDVPMAQPFKKVFRGGPPVRQAPSPKTWKLTTPRAGTRDPFVVDFGRPMNYTLLSRMLQVKDGRGRLSGIMEIREHETLWRFIPAQPWAGGPHTLVVDNGLEDLAGNKIDQPFDIDVFDKVTARIETSYTSLPFQIR